MVCCGLGLQVSTKDYGVEVWGLPRDAKEAEVAEHFSRLYPINGTPPSQVDRRSASAGGG
jgi:hypothetical protein